MRRVRLSRGRSPVIVAVVLLLGLTGCATTPSTEQGAGASTRTPEVPRSPTKPRSDCQRWVAPAPEGDNRHRGTQDAPWATLRFAARRVPDRGCTVWFEDGTYEGTNELDRGFDSWTTFVAVHPYRAVFTSKGMVLDVGGSGMVFEGLRFSHAGPASSGVVVYVSGGSDERPHHIVFRNDVFHDSYDDDLLKIRDGASAVKVLGNVFYNQGNDEQHIDVNSAIDVRIEGNIFFNDFRRSGRDDSGTTKHFIVVKDSNENDDRMLGSRDVTIDGNVFLNWEGGDESFVAVGNDGKPYFEARNVRIRNNLMIGNGQHDIAAAFTVSGAKAVRFVNNTVVGDLPSSAYAFNVGIKGSNAQNQDISFANNIWSDPTGTMGADLSGSDNEFSDGTAAETIDLRLDDNLYWNGGETIPPGDLVSPLQDDPNPIVGDPRLTTDQRDVVVPYWTGTSFLSGATAIRDEFVRLVTAYGQIPANSVAVGRAAADLAPRTDILGNRRDDRPDLGAFEVVAS